MSHRRSDQNRLRVFLFQILDKLTYKSRHQFRARCFIDSSTATRVGLCDRGFATSGTAPDINCLARRAATTTNANLLSGAWLSTVIGYLPSKRFQNLACAFTQTTAKTACSPCDRLYFQSGTVNIIIDHNKIILRITLNFLLGPLEPALNGFL